MEWQVLNTSRNTVLKFKIELVQNHVSSIIDSVRDVTLGRQLYKQSLRPVTRSYVQNFFITNSILVSNLC